MRRFSILQTGHKSRPEKYRSDQSVWSTIWLIAIGILTLSPFCSFAQLDTEHHIPPVWSSHEPGGITVYLNLSTPSLTPFQVTVVDGNGALLASPTISKGNSATVNLGNAKNAATANAFVMGDGGLGLTSEGLIVRADQPFYANYRAFEPAQAITMSAKGYCGYGTNFYTGHLVSEDTDAAHRGHYVSAMATEANTTVCFDGFAPGVDFNGLPTNGTPATTTPFCVVLQAGQSYVLGLAEGNLNDVGAPVSGPDHNAFHGTHVTSDKGIAVSSGSYLSAFFGNGNQDGGGDILLPVEQLGTEYILHQANGTTVAYGECGVFVAAYPNTKVVINGGTHSALLPNPGDEAVFCIADSAWGPNQNMYVQSDKPIYAYQTMTGGNSYVNLAMVQVPPLNCLMDDFVDSMANVNLVGNANVFITAAAGDAVTVNGTPAAASQTVLGTADWVTYRLTGLAGDQEVRSTGPISVSFVNTSGARSGAGYYSGLPSPPIITVSNDCPFTTLGVFSNTYESYQWYYEGVAIPGETGLTHTAMMSGDYLISGVKEGCGEFQSCVPVEVGTDLTIAYSGPICIDGCEGSPSSATFEMIVSNLVAGVLDAPSGMVVRVYDSDPFTTPANEIDTIIIPSAVPAGGSIRFPVEIDISAVASFPRDICFAINVRELATPPLSVLADFPAVTNGIFECSFANNVQCVRIECTPPDLFSR